MFRSRFWLVVLAVSGASACVCGRAPVNESLKAEGQACESDEECVTSLCDHLPGKTNVCIRRCAAGCKPGDLCTALAPNDRYACAPQEPGLCRTCAVDADCPYPADRCLSLGGSKICGRDCSFEGECPTSFRCADAVGADGSPAAKQCQPTSGTCECITPSAGQTKPCAESNAIGTCRGVQTCRPPSGYDACSAPIPSVEACNGRDDDCNGQTDENLGETSCGLGECRRTITNCINGTPQRCEAPQGTTEICDERDNNCDGTTDENFDKTSLQHCGACNTPCTRAHATPVCGTGGMCHIGMCDSGWVNANNVDSDGCEYFCTPTGVEICDGLDNDCNGRTDEGFALASDPTNCGQCGRVCNVNNGNISQYACVASTCGIMTCAVGYEDCDQVYATGCEKNTGNDVANCGACNHACVTPHATPACNARQCAIGTCDATYADCDTQVVTGCEIQVTTNVDHCGTCPNICPARANADRTCTNGGCGFTCKPGYVDLDGNPLTGCEYTCVPTGTDDPDDLLADTNCDGIDGDASRGIFVALSGDDSYPGTRAQPKLTIQAGINAASVNQPHVYVSTGTYAENVTLRNGVSIYGGYSASNGWARSMTQYPVTIRGSSVTSGRIIAVAGANLTAATTLAYLTISTVDTTAASVSTYGVYCSGCSGLVVRRANIASGQGGGGTAGSDGQRGADGLVGNNGTDGNQDGANGIGGPAAASACGREGGRGGNGGPEGNNVGETGDPGNIGTTGGPGGNGCRRTCSSCAGSPGTKGNDGTNGGSGPDGSGGSGAQISGGFLVCTAGSDGGGGVHGNGGGGGGGGGGQGGDCVNDGGGNGAGGGGSAGCGGTGATGGGGGGSSFAMFLVNSNGVVLEYCSLTGGNGGNGGPGGTGGGGGDGKQGGIGATHRTDEIGAGGDGGKGGNGGRGGHGGGGSGGYSYALYKISSSITVTALTMAHGTGGQGGTSPGLAGTAGTAADSN